MRLCLPCVRIERQADPDCYLAANFSAVKALDRHLKAIAKALDKGYNHRALEKVEIAKDVLQQLDASGASLTLAKLLQSACTAQGRMKRFEDVRKNKGGRCAG